MVHSNIAAPSIAWVILELGGKSPLIVCDDAIDLDEAVDIAHAAIFNNHGQNCCAGSRTFVQAGIYDKFVAKAKAKAEGRKVGDPWTDVEQGPQVRFYYDVRAWCPKFETGLNVCFTTISSHFLGTIFHKTEVQRVILRWWMGL